MHVTLSELMARHGLSQGALAKQVGLTQATISLYLSGKRVPNLRAARRIAQFFGVPLEVIRFAGEGPTCEQPGARNGRSASLDTGVA